MNAIEAVGRTPRPPSGPLMIRLYNNGGLGHGRTKDMLGIKYLKD